MLRQVVIFLGLGDPLVASLELNAAPEIETTNTKGTKVIKTQMITIRSQMEGSKLTELAEQNQNDESSYCNPEWNSPRIKNERLKYVHHNV